MVFHLIKNLDINNEKWKEIIELAENDLLKLTKNGFIDDSYRVNIGYLNQLLSEPYKNREDIINFLEEKKIDIEDSIKYKNSLFKNSKIKWLFQGNISKEEALEIAENANKILEIDIEQEKIGKFFTSRAIEITKNINYIFKKKNSNPNEVNSSLLSMYHLGLLNKKEVQY